MNAAFYPLDDFPPLARLADHCALIQREVAALQAPLLDIDRTDKPHQQVHAELDEHLRQGGSYGWLKGWGAAGGNRDWTQYPLLFQDTPLAPALAALPQTLALLQTLDGIKVASLARLAPHSFLSTHRHPEIRAEGLLQMHLTLSAASEANYAYLNVAGQFHQHQAGSAVIFDGSQDHFVVNASQAPRTILYLEFNKARAGR
ncbi:aspartyl/asparaginyl beta-hydroxylase domain-containing protein [Pseudomonas sp. 21LCFQ02]|uniref:aspartyl/asparaginyl beta-hydroxylase domain-containing protein n=1 Tax=unclassified Pseudomonas TaxID=196821 RepID=UPI0004F5CF7F|nr:MULTISPECIES: aspartyl/asparaginyl beta-hydroxylase domain-containing protein [unclassified Pseudomonas]MCO8161128.1 aspartyl/asparaginyl beta-hydroxylase domain-containing protein [Pseudomonas sp. 21LCFQ010]MCO8169099.1 aspartyl/asparaginyl beta-hydroxylase domain-containing protein [Pseudomonas sp. 21LCFQ02]MCQ9422104.1 aspartyl/asparaginyl beta-hydroxylase domain-containing protein [Pseudomonas sp. LJDD11]BAP46073.1 putative aspartyl beta-hydroxylase [Pseudomonas sp. StFLB209]